MLDNDSKAIRFVESAGVAQLVAQAICNRQVVGSSPTTGSVSGDLARFAPPPRSVLYFLMPPTEQLRLSILVKAAGRQD